MIFRLLYSAELLYRDATAYPSEGVWVNVKKTGRINSLILTRISTEWPYMCFSLVLRPGNVYKQLKCLSGRTHKDALEVLGLARQPIRAREGISAGCVARDSGWRSGVS